MMAATKALRSGVKPMSGSTMPACAAHSTPAKPGEAGSDGEGDDDQPVDVEADELGGAEILGRRAHAEPGIGARHEPAEEGERHAGQHDRQHVDLGEGDLPIVELDGLVHPVRAAGSSAASK